MLNQLAPRRTSCLMMFREVWLRIGFDVQDGCEEVPFRLHIGTPLVLRRRRECMPRTPLSVLCFMFRAICIPRRWPASSRSCFLAYLCGLLDTLKSCSFRTAVRLDSCQQDAISVTVQSSPGEGNA